MTLRPVDVALLLSVAFLTWNLITSLLRTQKRRAGADTVDDLVASALGEPLTEAEIEDLRLP